MSQGNNYYYSLNKVFEYIDNNLSDDLSLNELASKAGYSEFHFHRIFRSITGKSLHEYVMERKIFTAARKLLYDNKLNLTQIALECGFSSSSSFSRSFKQYFECSPSQYKLTKNRAFPVEFDKIVCRDFQVNEYYNGLFNIGEFNDICGAGIGVTGLSETWENPEIEKAYQELFRWVRKNNLTDKSIKVMGITLDTPAVQKFSDCRYYACIIVNDSIKCEGKIVIRKFKTAGKYIYFTIKRNQNNFSKMFFDIVDYLYGYYMPLKRLYPDNRPFVEQYKQNNDNLEITFFIPIRNL